MIISLILFGSLEVFSLAPKRMKEINNFMFIKQIKEENSSVDKENEKLKNFLFLCSTILYLPDWEFVVK